MAELYKRLITGFILLMFSGIIFFYLPPLYFSLLIMVIYNVILFIELPALFAHNKKLWFLVPLYPTLSCVIASILNMGTFRNLIPLTIILISVYDTGAYFIGKQFGTHRIAPHISPQKSWEGFAGGCIITLLAALVMQLFLCKAITPFIMIGIVIALCFLATLGDFFESFLKRNAGLKNSSELLPGHGGLLDRIDSLLFVIPLIWIFKSMLASYFCLF